MEINYNSLTFKFSDINQLPDFILIDESSFDLFKELFHELNSGIKIWKCGKITNSKNREFKISTEFTKNGHELFIHLKVKSFAKNINCSIAEIIFKVYKLRFPQFIIENFREGYDGSIIKYLDGNYSNCALDNILFMQKTNIGTSTFTEDVDFFDFGLSIYNDISVSPQRECPQVLVDYPDIEIYSDGTVIDIRAKSKPRLTDQGYELISYKGKNLFVHQLVAKAFVDNPNEYQIVNHLDGNRSNNNYLNLEWVNNGLNILHGKQKGIVAFSSLNYFNFIKDKIIKELNFHPNLWIFSNGSPIFLLYLPFSRMINKMPEMISQIILELGASIKNRFYQKNNLMFSDYFNERDFDSDCTFWHVVETINTFYLSVEQEHHIIKILQKLGIDLNDYLDYIFRELPKIINSEVGYIYFEEFNDYMRLIRNSSDEGIYINDIISNNQNKKNLAGFKSIGLENSRDFEKYIEKYGRLIDIPEGHRLRITEILNHVKFNDIRAHEIQYELKTFFLLQENLISLF
jgi:hypothetical protein